MVVEFVKPHGVFLPGRVVDLAGGVADVLLRRGVVRLPAPVAGVVPDAPEPPAVIEPPKPPAPKPKKGK